MKRKLLTDTELRARWSRERPADYYVEEGTILTPSAKDFIREHGITLRTLPASCGDVMTVTPVPAREGRPRFTDAAFSGAGNERPDIIGGLNRLSSCVYLIFCRKLSGFYKGGGRI